MDISVAEEPVSSLYYSEYVSRFLWNDGEIYLHTTLNATTNQKTFTEFNNFKYDAYSSGRKVDVKLSDA
jgi:hypothetical protein